MSCDNCRDEKPLYSVTFRQNIGLLIIRFPSSVQGRLCSKCVHRYFWKMTLTSMIMGWWGIISFFTNCFFILSNIVEYLTFLTSTAPPPQTAVPVRTKVRTIHPHSLERIETYRDQIYQAIQSGEARSSICERFSDCAIVPPSEIELYIQLHLSELS